MRNEYETWLKSNAPAGGAWTGKLLSMAAAVVATVVVGLSVVMMVGLDLPAGELPAEARGPATTHRGTPRPASRSLALICVNEQQRQHSPDLPPPIIGWLSRVNTQVSQWAAAMS